MSTKPALSIVVPVFNGAGVLKRNLPYAIEELRKSGLNHELILVDDGSTDNTLETAASFKNKIRILKLSYNQGKGGAVRQGVLAATGSRIFFTDVDFPYGIEAVIKNLTWFDEGFDLVIGNRNLKESGYDVRVSGMRRALSHIASALTLGMILPRNSRLTDTQCGFKGITKDAAQKIIPLSRINGFAFDIELLYLALKHGLDIKQVPVHLRENTTSSVHILRDSFKSGLDLMRIKWNDFNGRYNA
ncbi:MAG: glycosyltransferase [Elusimicrobia bacterium]|nr:glycosyltransferase [Elusimicrobiota bacterium]